MNNDLLPCPFCGGAPSDRGHGISCLGCGVWLGEGTQASEHGGGRKLWNTRNRVPETDHFTNTDKMVDQVSLNIANPVIQEGIATPIKDAGSDPLREAAHDLVDNKFTTFLKGKEECYIQDENGEQIWLVGNDEMEALERALSLPRTAFDAGKPNEYSEAQQVVDRLLKEQHKKQLSTAIGGAVVPCTWEEDQDGNWQTDCGNSFCLDSGTPLENGMKFCAYCGKTLLEDGNQAPAPSELIAWAVELLCSQGRGSDDPVQKLLVRAEHLLLHLAPQEKAE